MQKMRTNLIRNAAGFGLAATILSGCSVPEEVIETPRVEVRTVEVQRQKPIVPSIDPIALRDVDWIILTPNNIDAKIQELKTDELVFFALTTNGYENLSLNISNIRAVIEQQQRIIAIYEKQYK